jgi:hypothetical protein
MNESALRGRDTAGPLVTSSSHPSPVWIVGRLLLRRFDESHTTATVHSSQPVVRWSGELSAISPAAGGLRPDHGYVDI